MTTSRFITLPFNDRPTQFVRADLETAWLVLQEFDPAHDRMVAVRAAVSNLVHDYRWDKPKAMEYALVASHWDGKD